MEWIQEITNLTIDHISNQLGLKIGRMQSLSPCPSCGRDKRGSDDPRGPLGLTPNRKGFMCHRCDIKGDALDLISYSVAGGRFRELGSDGKSQVRNYCGDNGLIRRSSGGTQISSMRSIAAVTAPPPPKPKPKRVYTGIFAWAANKPPQYKSNLHSPEGAPVLSYLLNDRKLSLDVLKQADIGCVWEDKGTGREYWISIPLKDESGTIVNMRFRSVPPVKKKYRVCPEQPLPLYGAGDLDRRNDTIIITEGELDVLAMRTYGFGNIVSGTAGATANWKETWLDCLEPFKSFVLLYDDDTAGEDGASKLAKALGEYRCFRCKIRGHNDPNEALMAGVPVADIERDLGDFQAYLDPKLARVDHFTQDLEQLILNPHSTRGGSTFSRKIDECVGGIRAGLWVITGDTGAGKSTWANWLCYEQAKADIPIMLTSFENRPIGTVQKLLRMHLGGDFTKRSQGERAQGMRDLGNMPIYIMNHYGEMSRNKTIEAVRFATRRHGVKIALIDHLGFLTTPKDQGEDERLLIESTVRELCQIAVQDDITIMLICHPNNTSVYQNRRVKITDLKGASAIRQDAHVGVVVERRDGGATPATNLYFDKVRSEFGRAGSHCEIAFDPLSCVYADDYAMTPSGANGKVPIQPAQQNPRGSQ